MGTYIAQHSTYAPTYTSSATLAVRVKNGTSQAIENLSASADTAGLYAAVFQGDTMQALAAAHLGMDTFPGTVAAAAVNGINLMVLSVTAAEPALAYRLLDAILAVYPQISDALFSNTVIDLLEAPQMPDTPSQTLSSFHCMVWILLAMFVETCLILLLSLCRETVKNEQAFDKQIDGELLGMITHETAHMSCHQRLLRRHGSLRIDSPYASLRFSEDYHKLATKLEYLKKNQNAAVYAITSVLEHEGKSTITMNLAMALAERGYRVVVLDLDLHKPSLYTWVGTQVADVPEFCDVLAGKTVVETYGFLQYKPGLLLGLHKVVHAAEADLLDSAHMQEILSVIRTKADFVLLDTPPTSVSADAASLVRIADRAILAIRIDRASAADINDTIETLSHTGGHLAGCVLNDVYRPFTFFGQMGTDETGAYAPSYRHDPYGYRRTDGSGV